MNKTILICDDDEGIIEMMEILLQTYGFRTVTERNSINLIEKAKAIDPDLILLDLWMPVLSGDIVLRNLRKHLNGKHIPVIIVSASTDGEDIAITAGADDFLGKPFELKALLGKIDRLLN